MKGKMNSIKDNYNKIVSIINSCNTIEQLDKTIFMIINFHRDINSFNEPDLCHDVTTLRISLKRLFMIKVKLLVMSQILNDD